MLSRLNRSTQATLGKLNAWYPRFFDALALLQKGNLDWLEGRGVVAMHRDYGGPWHEHQPRFVSTNQKLLSFAKQQEVMRVFCFEISRSGWYLKTLG
ncbi:hypothetical protein M3P05_14180 [Sansalvadorimonas sp. 2012CJ34-2]|uniref:Uncharacterized protein n=1 Tax=Parendozoicomonas callyspongiae TaxID=2942213 RepID=A0ABT0PIB5_9GAMM|nr:hypothetical protein [Sansalvadorimonas sp. 2012CJ34-2]MCL6271073.1 hypothetical protein [Sansalvadorimonas sp. 2012CJ34-2]